MSSYPATERYSGPRERGSSALAGALVVLLGLAVGALVLVLVVVARAADQARDDAAAASAQVATSGQPAGHDHSAAATGNTSLPLTSFAGKAAPNAEALAEAHAARPASLPADGYQFKLVGNAIADSARWPISIDGSHFGLIFRNVVHGAIAAGVVGEAGNESYNLVQENLVLAVTGPC